MKKIKKLSLKDKLSLNVPSVGSWVTIGHTSIIEIMSSANFDWLAIDMEHSTITIDIIQDLIIACKSRNKDVLVRVGKNEELIIKRVMDAGADGVIVPMVLNEKDALDAVSFLKYPPKGKRGVGLSRAQNYGIGFEKYKEWEKTNSILIVQIEHIESVKSIEKIINVDGVDGAIIGPYDLSASMGIPGDLNNPKLLDCIQNIKNACSNKNFPLGYHVIEPNHKEVNKMLQSGFSFIGFSLDFYFLGEKARKEVEKIKL